MKKSVFIKTLSATQNGLKMKRDTLLIFQINIYPMKEYIRINMIICARK